MKEEIAKQLLKLKDSIDKILDDAKSIHAPCENAYKDSRDGLTVCTCWRCRDRDDIPKPFKNER